jgi:hypothetical protein
VPGGRNASTSELYCAHELGDSANIDTGHYKSGCKGVSVAVPGVVGEASFGDRWLEPVPRGAEAVSFGIAEDEAGFRLLLKNEELVQGNAIQWDMTRFTRFGFPKCEHPSLQLNIVPAEPKLF